jgi:FAD/FMN-containing dehydrogenase
MRTGIAAALRRRVRGDVIDDPRGLRRYARDQSIYSIAPTVVVVPHSVDDVLAALEAAREAGLPVTARAGGSGTAGAALGRGLVMAFRKDSPLNRILGIGPDAGALRAVAEPAVLHSDLQAALRRTGHFLPADPSSGNISLIGGNIATKASGPHALRHGSIDRYLHSLHFVTADGLLIDTADETTIPETLKGGLEALRDEILADGETVELLEGRMSMKVASGYNLFAFLRCEAVGDLLAQLLVGSVGTLGIVVRATLGAEPVAEGHSTTLLYFAGLDAAGEAASRMRELPVDAIEIISHRTVAMVREHHPELPGPDGEAHMLLVGTSGPGRRELQERVERLARGLGDVLVAPPVSVEDEKGQEAVWRIRKALLPTVRTWRRGMEALSVVNDVGVPPHSLAPFIRDAESIFDELGLRAAIYGHAGSGNLHLRPLFDAAAPDLPELIRRVADRVYEAVVRYGGTITAEHGMGRVRAPYLTMEWGRKAVAYMRRVKELLDPEDLLNPGVMFSDRPITEDLAPLRRPAGPA